MAMRDKSQRQPRTKESDRQSHTGFSHATLIPLPRKQDTNEFLQPSETGGMSGGVEVGLGWETVRAAEFGL
jgi:hypothetical protein